MTPKRIRFSLGAKFLGLFLLVVVATGLLVGWYLFDGSRRSLAEQIEQRAGTIAWTLAFNSRYAVLTADRIVLEDLAAETLKNEDVVYVRIVDAAGEPLVDRRRDDLAADLVAEGLRTGSIFEVTSRVSPAATTGTVRVDPDEEALFGVGATAGRDASGTVHLGLSRARMEEGLRGALRSSLLVFGAATSLGLAALVLFVHYIITPIRRLSDGLALVAAGDLATRLPVDRHDEIGELARSFNSMAEALRVSRAAALEAQDALLHSTRLAAVGELAGQAAHEILNPLSAIYGKLDNERHHMASLCAPMLGVLEQIIEGWLAEYDSGGWPALERSLKKTVPGPDGAGIPLLLEDLDNLRRIAAGLRRFQGERSHDLDLLLREVERVTRIVDGMRSMTRAGAFPQEIRIEEVIADSVELMRDSLEKRGIQVVVEGSREPALVRADRDEMVQIFTNLLRNAMQAIDSTRSRGEGVIQVQVEPKDGLVEIRLEDNGSGIPQESQGRIFDTTFTSKGPKDGTGLGLGICRRLARGARGDVRLARSAPGKGTAMVVELPRVSAS